MILITSINPFRTIQEDIRLEQRFTNYKRALQKLSEAVAYIQSNASVHEDKIVLDEILKEGLIQRFEYTHELAWNVMKEYAKYQGFTQISGSRDTIKEAFKMQLIEDDRLWLEMVVSRNKTSHTYN